MNSFSVKLTDPPVAFATELDWLLLFDNEQQQ